MRRATSGSNRDGLRFTQPPRCRRKVAFQFAELRFDRQAFVCYLLGPGKELYGAALIMNQVQALVLNDVLALPDNVFLQPVIYSNADLSTLKVDYQRRATEQTPLLHKMSIQHP